MPDREKIIRELKAARLFFEMGSNHAGIIGNLGCKSGMKYMDDALALLKEQEAVPPERESSGGGITWWNVCGACRVAINPNDKYCHECGRPVRWPG